jgi:hypothetical protein
VSVLEWVLVEPVLRWERHIPVAFELGAVFASACGSGSAFSLVLVSWWVSVSSSRWLWRSELPFWSGCELGSASGLA